jgi:CheY-like chemotaxis protein
MPLLNLEKNTLLIVEDDDMSFLYLSQIFRLTRGNIIRARNGHEAIRLVQDHTGIDLVLMDIQLPDMDGNAVTREILRTRPDIPIIAQTAGKTQYEKDMALDAGCSDVLIKPFKMEELMIMLGKYIKSE